MTNFCSGFRFLRFAQVLCLALLIAFTSCTEKKTGPAYPAAPGFNLKGSDKKAIAIADRMMEQMGGYEAWQNSRFISWTYFGQYQIWDKQEGLYRHEKANQVSIINLNKRAGQIFQNGVQITDTTKIYGVLGQTYTHFIANTYFLAMPFKMKDPGVTLLYRGEGKTKDGKPADIVRLIFNEAGISPDNMHDVWIEKETGLPAQWGFYASRADAEPSFVRKWTDYKEYNGLKLATNRDSAGDTLGIYHLAITDFVPKEIFLSPTPVDKTKIK